LQKFELPPTPNLLPPPPQPQQSAAATSCSHSSLSTFNTTKTTKNNNKRSLAVCCLESKKSDLQPRHTTANITKTIKRSRSRSRNQKIRDGAKIATTMTNPTVLRFVATSDLEEISKTNRGVQEFCICTGYRM
jgi:hypothetical protein